jgi:hypothetical protein
MQDTLTVVCELHVYAEKELEAIPARSVSFRYLTCHAKRLFFRYITVPTRSGSFRYLTGHAKRLFFRYCTIPTTGPHICKVTRFGSAMVKI